MIFVSGLKDLSSSDAEKHLELISEGLFVASSYTIIILSNIRTECNISYGKTTAMII